MDSKSKKMIKHIKKQGNALTGVIPYTSLYDDFCKENKITLPRAQACVRYLLNEGYIRSITDQNNRKVGIGLEHKAYEQSSFTRQAVYAFLGKSILVPIIVTILTLIVINLGKDVLPPWLSLLLES